MDIVRHGAAKDNGEAFERLLTSIETAIEINLNDGDMSFENLESILLRVTNEAVRRHLQGRLQRIADAFGNEITVKRRRYRRHQPGRARYFSLCGSMMVNRWTYRPVDERNGKTIVALDLAAGVVQCATPALAFAIAQGVAKAPIRSVEEDLVAAFRVPPSRSKMDRVGRELGRQVDGAVEEIEPLLRQREMLPIGAKAINLGIDRTTIPMEESTETERKLPKLKFVEGIGATIEPVEEVKPKVVVRYRMGYVATFCITDENCEPLVTRRYAAPAHDGPNRIIERIKADLERALEQNPRLTIGIVQDGAAEMWNLMRGMLDSIPQLARPRQMGIPRHWKETIDRYHLMEKLSLVLELLLPRNQRRRAEVYAGWNTALDHHANAIQKIEKWINDQKRGASQRVQAEIERIIGGYFAHPPQQFQYASLARFGLHQGSGVTEGACKSLITMRAKRSGQRWRRVGISSVLAIRSLLESDRLPAFWKHLKRRFVAPPKIAA
jgi:hypothetical protein